MLLAKISGRVVSAVRKNGGTAFPGRLALFLDKKFPENFDSVPPEKIIFITGSNGKSTVTSLIRHILESNGKKVAYSKKGTNLAAGITTIFIYNCKLDGTPTADYYLVEADERLLPVNIATYKPAHLVVTNVMQDQMHRNGEPDFIYRLIKGSITKDMTLYLNAHEPRGCSYGMGFDNVRYYAVDRHALAAMRGGQFDVSMACPVCGGRIEFEYENSAKMGAFCCAHCSLKTPNENVTLVTDADFDSETFKIGGVDFKMPYSAPIMLYNYAAAACVLTNLGFSLPQISDGLNGFVNIAGRFEALSYKGRELHYIRMKQENPETLQGALDAIAMDKRKKLFVIGLCTLDERRPEWQPHYTNTYYAYDCDFKPLLNSGVEHIVCFSKYVCDDIANRLMYDGAAPDDITIFDSDRPDEVMKLVDSYDAQVVYLITLLRVYEGFRAYIKREGK